MKTKIIKKIVCILALFSLFLFTNIRKTYASSTKEPSSTVAENTLEIDYSKEKFDYNIEDIEVKFWKIGLESDESYSEDLLLDLHKLDEERLDKRYPSYKRIGEIKDNILSLDKLEDGFYYIRFDFKYDEKIGTTEFLFSLPYQGLKQIRVKAKTTFKKEDLGEVELLKLDDEDNKLENVGFDLYKLEDDKEYKVKTYGKYTYDKLDTKANTLYTNEDGKLVVKELPFGKYYFKEVQGLDGYVLDDKKHYFEVNSSEKIYLEVVNEKIKLGSIEFLKQADDKEKNPLQGAEFKVVYEKDGKEYPLIQDGKEVSLISDKDGSFKLSDLAYGTYKIYETKAPEGYVKLEDSLDFVINGESNKKVLIIKNKKKPPFTIPQTGDAVAMVLLIVALIFIVIGYRFVNNKKVEKQ